jgi:cobalamin biosynthesis protein CobD/CbiB
MDRFASTASTGRTPWSALAWIGGVLATLVAVSIGAILAVFATAAVVILALMTSATLAFAALAARAGRKARVPAREGDLLEARKVGGHHWVAYGWNERR